MFLSFRQFLDEEWHEMWDPSAEEYDTLLRQGAPGRKNFVAWFMEKVISNLSLLPGLTFVVYITRN